MNNNNRESKEKNNHYKDYLPENRIKKEQVISPKVLKFGLCMFWAFIFVIAVGIGLHFKGIDVLKVEPRNYNMNLAESINLDNVYTSSNVVWESTSDNVTIKNNVITAIKSGAAYVYAREGDKLVSDANIKILNGEEKISIENHDIQLKVNQPQKISVTQNNDSVEEDTIIMDSDYESGGTENIDDNNNTDSIDNKENDTNDIGTSNSSTNNSDNNLKYESSNEDIAKVDESGNIEPISPGTVVITVSDEEGNKDHSYVTVEENDLILARNEYKMNVGDKIKIDYQLNNNNSQDLSQLTSTNEHINNNNNNNNITLTNTNSNTTKTTKITRLGITADMLNWSSNNPNIASVDNGGNVTAIALGNTDIIVKVNDIIKKIKISVSQNDVLPESLEIQKNNYEIMPGESVTTNYEVFPNNTKNKSISWTSMNEKIATVIDGKIIGKSEGTTQIIATTINGLKQIINVNIPKKNILDESITFTDSNLSLKIGESKKVTYTITPDSTTDKTVKFDYDKNYVSIDENCNLTALKAGTTKLTVTTANNHTDTMNITITSPVVPVNSIKINEGNLSLNKGDNRQLTTTIQPSNATDKSVTWSSNNTGVVSVDSNGKIYANAAGTAKITATSNGISNSIDVTVKEVVVKKNVTSIKSSVNSKTLKYKGTFQLQITINPSDATNKGLSYKSSDTSIATVNASGLVTAKSKMGSTTITITSQENSNIKTTVKITVVPSSGANGESAKTYTSLKKLGKLTIKKSVDVVSKNNDYRWAQGFCVADNVYVTAHRNTDNTKAYVKIINKSNGKAGKSYTKSFGHANGMTYNPDNKKIYVLLNGSSDTKDADCGNKHNVFYSFDKSDVTTDKINAKKGCFLNKKNNSYLPLGGIAYDKETKLFYLASGMKVNVYNLDTKTVIRTVTKVYNVTSQDIGAYNGMIFVIRYNGDGQKSGDDVKKAKNAIDIYRASDGGYLGSYTVNSDMELESIDYYGTGNKFSLYFNKTGTYTSYIYTADIPLNFS